MRTGLYILRSFFIYFILCIVTFLMLRIIIDYSAFRDNTRFLQYKQDYIHDPVWRTAFYIHVFTAILALLAGFTQFSEDFLKKHRSLHRLIGRGYALIILFINFPAGMILAVNANGLLPSRIAFTLLDCCWFWFTAKAVLAARQRRIKEHKHYMIRSYALTFSAITLRTWKIILSHSIHPDPLTLYMIDAWMGFVPNLLFAEWLIRRKPRSNTAIAPAAHWKGSGQAR
ncbi:MAG TPA: DUF2306 domain-containing protein [Puia sp.]|nr:DUF2306 domain-containing protein [Puia sp.]